jgi:quercetin dioxygenase-like cupin family protein
MNMKTRLIVGGAVATCAIAGLALATPSLLVIYNNILSTGVANNDIHTHAHVALPGEEEEFSAEVETEGPANFIVQDVIFSPGGTTGWHTHPGVLLLSLTADSGSVDWYDANCGKHVYHAGDSWTEGTKLHDVVNNSSVNAHFVVTYIVAKGLNKRTDQPAPACAAALGLR